MDQIPDRARRAPFRDDHVEIAAESRVEPDDRLRPSSGKGCDFFFLDHRLKAGDDAVDATACGLKAKFTFH